MDTQLLLKTAMLAGEIMLRSGADMEEVTGKTPGKISGSRAGVPAVRSVVSGRVLPLSGDAGGTSGGRAAGRKTVPGLRLAGTPGSLPSGDRADPGGTGGSAACREG